MITITLKGGAVREVESGTTVYELAGLLGAGLQKAACCARIDRAVADLRTPLTAGCAVEICTFDDADGRKAFRHTAAHILAQAVKRLYPNTRLGVGPATDNGFFYDFEVEKPFDTTDLASIEAEMQKIIKEKLPVERFTLSTAEAHELMASEPYKLELIDEHTAKGDTLSFYRQGDFTDLCAGPHMPDTGRIKAIKLTQATSAYWRGDSTKATLCRVYGTAFPKASELEAYLAAVEEAKKRDHNLIGRQLGYFTTSDLIGQGLPLLMPKGAKLFQILNRYVEDLEEQNGYLLTRTPYMAKSDLYKISGHWDHYRDGMFILGDPDADKEVYALRPMTCPFQYMIYKEGLHSYKDLPKRYGETSMLFRNEASGEMHGLIRVRQFTLSEGHLIVTPQQLEEEFRGVLGLIHTIMTDLRIADDLTYRFSKWDPNNREKYIGSPEEWEYAQELMRNILDHMGLDYHEAEGEAAFYGPKLDIQFKNVHGKEDTLITVQIDLKLSERFDMVYVDADGVKKHPYIIHRSSLGCYERTIALLLEKYAGALPAWLSPTQVILLPISDNHLPYAKQVAESLRVAGVRVSIDERREKIGYKIREAQMEKLPYMLVIGEKEVESGTVSVRSRSEGDLGSMPAEEFRSRLLDEVAGKA